MSLQLTIRQLLGRQDRPDGLKIIKSELLGDGSDSKFLFKYNEKYYETIFSLFSRINEMIDCEEVFPEVVPVEKTVIEYVRKEE